MIQSTVPVDGPPHYETYDFIVVGSGAGGGPLASNLVKAGFRVLLLEAGGDALLDENGNEIERLTYSVPAFHARSTEDDDLRWSFYVKHYTDPERQKRDSKYDDHYGGVLYPRAGTLGGCTAHNALILVYPFESDWDVLAEITGDSTWSAREMRKYFERLEHCDYIDRPINGSQQASRHGFDGWLTTNLADPKLLTRDWRLLKLILQAAKSALSDSRVNPLALVWALIRARFESLNRFIRAGGRGDPWEFLDILLDPNDARRCGRGEESLVQVPMTIRNGSRVGAREYIRLVEKAHPERFTVRLHALVTKVLFDEQDLGIKAIGVEYMLGKHLYRADPRASRGGDPVHSVGRAYVTHEVILCGGTFNTPQLLKLSGIGPSAELTQLGIPVRVDLPGVGANLQDRYEIGVVHEMNQDFSLLKDTTFKEPQPPDDGSNDAALMDWRTSRSGIYTTNGAVLGILKKSSPELPEADLFIFGLPAYFKGYFLNYSKQIGLTKNRFTWAILKARTNNSAGSVTLTSIDPRDTPDVNFRYFDEGNDHSGSDLDAVVNGFTFVKKMTKMSRLYKKLIVPSMDLSSDSGVRDFIKNEAWGHHACGTCKIGNDYDDMAVLDGDFRVRGTQGLRVVDASAFPRIPGYFIVCAIYMLSEKAADVIIGDAVRTPQM